MKLCSSFREGDGYGNEDDVTNLIRPVLHLSVLRDLAIGLMLVLLRACEDKL
jgi:hypothetical protein